MASMITLKLKNGADVIGYLTEEHDEFVLVENPVEMQVDPEFGFFAKSYLLLAQGTIARFNKSDLLLLAPANEKAVHYYEEFSGRLDEIQASRENFDPEELEDIEDTMRNLLESRMSTKH